MKKFFSSIYFKILIVILPIVTVCLLGFYGYNEYTYNKIGICFSEGNYSLAENYAESISPSYKDIRKIKSLILTINTHNSNNAKDIERTYERLESFKGFENENINYVYNNLLFSVYKEMTSVTISPDPHDFFSNASVATTFPTITEEVTSVVTTVYTTAPSVIFSAAQTTEFSTEFYSTTQPEYYQESIEIITQQTEPTTTSKTYSTEIVYYVESGEVYHVTPDCRTLAKSTNILSGPIPSDRRACKVCS